MRRKRGGCRIAEACSRPLLDAEPDAEDVPVLDQVFLTLEAHEPLPLQFSFRSAGNEVVVGETLGPNEPAGQVAVDSPGRRYHFGV